MGVQNMFRRYGKDKSNQNDQKSKQNHYRSMNGEKG
uniref:Uncharacterized protein n=1 Tax=Arundo donax TaxID=35708 RepID=A0A0A8ZPD7_ARUDO